MSVQSMPILMTEVARTEVKRLLEEKNQDGLGLRLGVAGGGCSGLTYKLDFTLQEPGDNVLEAEEGFRIFVDPKSLLYLKNMQVDYQGGLNGKGFVFNNPNAQNTCGCGESFSV
ncbi:MAG: iron-sulfur cluster assembly accessory protein [Candidatus Eisenbacteria bacterium]|uniref:Iron-sulfur cluster assembly accessory protein n=1 Tax=Eiseniibacteriota bacterium TaxID=2212470 RepID=A0A7Y2E6H0_UNCEI|nr:iron-sulfur cluster assembly accessory protein [Candidatus Eisenbacteria bacterium]